MSEGCQATSWGHFALSLGLLPLCCPLGLHFRSGSTELPFYWKTEAARRDHASGSSPPPQHEALPTAPCIQPPVLGGALGSCSAVILPLHPVMTTEANRAPAQIANCLLLLASEPRLWLPSTTLKSCLYLPSSFEQSVFTPTMHPHCTGHGPGGASQPSSLQQPNGHHSPLGSSSSVCSLWVFLTGSSWTPGFLHWEGCRGLGPPSLTRSLDHLITSRHYKLTLHSCSPQPHSSPSWGSSDITSPDGQQLPTPPLLLSSPTLPALQGTTRCSALAPLHCLLLQPRPRRHRAAGAQPRAHSPLLSPGTSHLTSSPASLCPLAFGLVSGKHPPHPPPTSGPEAGWTSCL